MEESSRPNSTRYVPTYPPLADTTSDSRDTPVETRNAVPRDNIEPSTTNLTRIVRNIQHALISYAGISISPAMLPELSSDDLNSVLGSSNNDREPPFTEDILSLEDSSNRGSPSSSDAFDCRPTKEQSYQSMCQEQGTHIQRGCQSMVQQVTFDTYYPQQKSPAFASGNIIDESSHPTHVGNTIGTTPFSSTTIQSTLITTAVGSRERARENRYMPYMHSHRANPAGGIRAGTSQNINCTETPSTDRAGEEKYNASGRNQPTVNEPSSTYPHHYNSGGRSFRCAGNRNPGGSSPFFLYDVDTGEKIYDCGTCGSQFQDDLSHRYHLDMHFNDIPLECNVCKCVHNKGERPFACRLCVMKFWHEKDYEWHRRVHSNLRPFICHFCGAGFWKKRLLDRHSEAGIIFL